MNRRALRVLGYRIEWLALRAVLSSVKRGDASAAMGRARGWAWFGRHLLRGEWGWALRNLALVFGPGLTAGERHHLAILAFEQHFMSYLEGARADAVEFSDVDPSAIAAATAGGRGCILASAHLGSWEPALRLGPKLGHRLAVVYRPADNPWSEAEFARARASYGVEWIEKRDAASMIRALRSGKLLVLMSDLNTKRDGITAEFLGLPAQCPAGPARLALRLGCAIVPVISLREAPGKARLVFAQPIEPASFEGMAPKALRAALTRQVNATLEPWILEYAEQYNWLHPRWRMRPDGSTWTLSTPLDAMLAARTTPFADVSPRVRALLHHRVHA